MLQQAPMFRSPLAGWSRTLAVFSLQLLIVAIVLHRLLSLSTPVAINLFLAAMALAVTAVLLAFGAYVAIWRDGRLGGGNATIGLLLGLALLGWPMVLIPLYMSLPLINDISTDTVAPPGFVALATKRQAGANPIDYAGPEAAKLQRQAFPDIRPLFVNRSVDETWEVMGDTVRRLGWTIANQTPPQGPGRPGYIEAVDRTLILGFHDDVVVRVDGHSRQARVDVRSTSRYGRHDFGRNVKRVRGLLKEFQARLEATVTGKGRGNAHSTSKRQRDDPKSRGRPQ